MLAMPGKMRRTESALQGEKAAFSGEIYYWVLVLGMRLAETVLQKRKREKESSFHFTWRALVVTIKPLLCSLVETGAGLPLLAPVKPRRSVMFLAVWIGHRVVAKLKAIGVRKEHFDEDHRE